MFNNEEATQRVMLGESLRMIAADYRQTLLAEMGFDPEEVESSLFEKETSQFMRQLCRHLGDTQEGETRVSAALRDWVRQVEDYEAYDALLSHYDFAGKDVLINRGRMLFPGPLTAHWSA